MDVVSHHSLVSDTSVVSAITLTTVRFVKRDLIMNIHSSRFKDQEMLPRLLLLLSMTISHLLRKFLNNKKKKLKITTAMDMDMAMVMVIIITIEVEEVAGDTT
jgi:hypothetical protein